jgi:hypothetical protein
VGSVAEQRDYGHGYGKKCHGQGYGSQLPIVGGVFGVLLQFLEFVAHTVLLGVNVICAITQYPVQFRGFPIE